MKAIVFEDINRLQLHNDYPKPTAKKGWVVIKVMAAGVCATDLDIIAGDFGNPPVVLGHEICGDVVEVGEDVKNFKVGDRVVVETVVESCGHCEHCLSGNKHLCKEAIEIGFPHIDGGYEQYTTCPESCLHKIPDNISYDEGGILEAVLCPYGLIYRYGIKENETVLIQGTGIAGLSFIQTIKLFNPKKIIVAVRRKESVNLAYKYGADVVIIGKGKDYKLQEAIQSIKEEYDIVVLDLPPGLGVVTLNALTAASCAIIPAMTDSRSAIVYPYVR